MAMEINYCGELLQKGSIRLTFPFHTSAEIVDKKSEEADDKKSDEDSDDQLN